MSALPTRRSSLCLFCAVTAARPRPQRLRLPYVQVAHRSPSQSNKGTKRLPLDFNTRLEKSNPTDRNLFGRPKTGRDIRFNTIGIQLERLRQEFAEPDFLESLSLTPSEFDKEWQSFERSINVIVRRGFSELLTLASNKRTAKRLETRLRYMFYAQACGGLHTQAELENQKRVADLRFPTEWYPATREICRTVHLHVGPTNSGKTYQALKRLEEANSGIYLGPLRLLAHEVYTRLTAKGRLCALVTGEEQRMPEGDVKMWSCTVEMAPLNTRMEVAVIDEIQMINHPERGWAWTQAFLGLQAKEIHLCGEARTVPLIRELCALIGDKVHVHEYERLTPLEVAPQSLGSLSKLEKGDCVVSFSVLGIHALRKAIEKKTGRKCAIVYGSLPPETRAQQARLFNDPDNDYDFLVASDAIGMGLNLSIKRVIFESIVKNNGNAVVPLQTSEIKQIAGRAGRYKSAHQAVAEDKAKESAVDPVVGLDDTLVREPEKKTIGYATTLDQLDFLQLQQGMEREAEPIETAGLFPPSLIVERFANYFPPGTPFSYIMLRLHDISNIHPRFQLCALKDQLTIADAIHKIKNLSIQDRIMLCAAPSNMRDPAEKAFMQELATCIAENKPGDLLEMPKLPLEILDKEPSGERDYLKDLERLHKMLVLYLWLSYRFPNIFTSRKLTTHVTKLVEDKIEQTLTQFSFTDQYRAGFDAKRRKAIKQFTEKDKKRGSETIIGDADVVAADVPQVVRDVLEDSGSIDKVVVPPSGAEYQYSTPDLHESRESNGESEELEPRQEEEGHDELEISKADDTESTLATYDPTNNLLTKQASFHIDMKPDQPDSTPPRV